VIIRPIEHRRTIYDAQRAIMK